MDDMQKSSSPLYGQSEPNTAKTTMSFREMQHLLGLGKTESYWLLHKNFFEVILINDKMRIVISSFERWYANQIKYHTLTDAQAQAVQVTVGEKNCVVLLCHSEVISEVDLLSAGGYSGYGKVLVFDPAHPHGHCLAW